MLRCPLSSKPLYLGPISMEKFQQNRQNKLWKIEFLIKIAPTASGCMSTETSSLLSRIRNTSYERFTTIQQSINEHCCRQHYIRFSFPAVRPAISSIQKSFPSHSTLTFSMVREDPNVWASTQAFVKQHLPEIILSLMTRLLILYNKERAVLAAQGRHHWLQ